MVEKGIFKNNPIHYASDTILIKIIIIMIIIIIIIMIITIIIIIIIIIALNITQQSRRFI